MEKIKVSVIVPVYNTEKYLEQCLKSLLCQTLKEIEIICVDDGSLDRSVEIVQSFCREDSRVRLMTQANQGGGAARNLGMGQALGKYLMFLDSDDFFAPQLLEKMYLRCEETEAQVCVCKARCYHEDLGFETPEPAAMREEFLPSKEVFCWQDMPDTIFNTFHNWPWNKMFLRSFVEEKHLQFQEIRRTNDLLFTCLSLVLAESLSVCKEELVYYRVGISGSCQTTNKEAPLDFFHAFYALKKELEKRGIFAQVEKSFVNHSLDGCIANLNSQEKNPCQKALYDQLKNELFEKLSIHGQEKSYFHACNQRMYGFYQVICGGTYEDYLRYRIEDLKEERDRCLVSDYHEKVEWADRAKGYWKERNDLLACREYRLGAKMLYLPLKIRNLFR